MKIKRIAAVVSAVLTAMVFMSACNPADGLYGVTSESSATSKVSHNYDRVKRPKIMSDDKVMAKFVDISLFDEENYSDIYLGKRFKFNVSFAGSKFEVPTTLSKLEEAGWQLTESDGYDINSQLYACDTVDAVFENGTGVKISAKFFNSANSSVSLKKCNIVKFGITNDFYSDPAGYNEFSINGINNKMAITDIIDTLGTPSHFYGISDSNYYLDYFISESDRRNGITVHINPAEDCITAVEFSYYK